MELIKSVWSFLTDKDVLLAISGVISSLAVLARYTKWKWDDKLFSALEWPFKKLFGK